MSWRFSLNDLKGNRLGELEGATRRSVYRGLKKNPTASVDVPLLEGGLVDEMIHDGQWRILTAHHLNPYTGNWDLRFSGPVINTEEVVGEGLPTVSLLAVGPWIRATKRVADDLDRKGRTPSGLVLPSVGRRAYAAQLIRASEAVDGPHWLRALPEDQSPDTPDNTAASILTGGQPWAGYKRLDEAIADLSDSYGGFEWVIDPILEKDEDLNRIYLGRFKSADVYGRDLREAVLFDYGVGQHNVKSLRRTSTLEDYINRATHVNGDTHPYAISSQESMNMAEVGVWEEIIGAELDNQEMRASLVGAHSAVRGQGSKVMVDIEVERSDLSVGWIPGLDYDVGDRVGLRAFYANALRINGGLRVYDLTVEISDNGEETAKLSLYDA